MFHRFLLTALLVGGLFGCVPVSQIPRPGSGTGGSQVEPPGLDIPDISGTWVVENGEKTLRQFWTLEMTGNVLTGTFVNAPEMQAPGVVEQPRPVQGRVLQSGTIYGVRLENPTGVLSIVDANTIYHCPVAGSPSSCRAGKRYTGSPPPAASPSPTPKN